jgi:hypothetical protein
VEFLTSFFLSRLEWECLDYYHQVWVACYTLQEILLFDGLA